MARPRKQNILRDTNGKSRGERPDQVMAVVLTQRTREVGAENAFDALAGFTLGRLLLRGRADPSDPSSINEIQYAAGEEWGRVVRAYQAIVTNPPPGVRAILLDGPGGRSCTPDPADERIAETRDRFRVGWCAIDDTPQPTEVRRVCYLVCVENSPMALM